MHGAGGGAPIGSANHLIHGGFSRKDLRLTKIELEMVQKIGADMPAALSTLLGLLCVRFQRIWNADALEQEGRSPLRLDEISQAIGDGKSYGKQGRPEISTTWRRVDRTGELCKLAGRIGHISQILGWIGAGGSSDEIIRRIDQFWKATGDPFLPPPNKDRGPDGNGD